MIRWIKALLLIWIMSASTLAVFAQADTQTYTPKKHKLFIGFSPPHILLHGMKLDFIVPIAKRTFLYMSPELYTGSLNYWDEGKLSGFGLHPGLRYAFGQKEKKGMGLIGFVQGTLEYSNFRIDYRGRVWQETVRNGQNVLVLAETDVYKRYQRIGIQYGIGGLWYFPSGFYTELSMGVTARKSYMSSTKNHVPLYLNNDFFWSYGYSGVAPVIGFKFGALIR